MKKWLCVILILLLSVTSVAFAEDIPYIENGDMSQWNGTFPEWWSVDSPDALCEEDSVDGESCAYIHVDDSYALLSQEVYLEPETSYMATVRYKALNIEGDMGVNLGFYGQAASISAFDAYTGDWQELSLIVRTNVDDYQCYTFYAGIGDEYSSATGEVYISNITFVKLDELPEDALVMPLIGSISDLDDDGGYVAEEGPDDTNEGYTDDMYDVNVNYNNVGIALFFVVLTAAVYLAVTGRWSGRLGKWLSRRGVMLVMFAAALILRIMIAARAEGHITDLTCFKAWAANMHTYGFSGFYESGIFADYPPGYMYVLYFMKCICDVFGFAYESTGYKIVIELPAIIADLALAYIAWRYAKKKHGEALGALMALTVLVLPSLILTSSVWGQIDSVFILAVVGVGLLVQKKRLAPAALVWFVALMIKPQALIIAPALLYVFIGELINKETRLRTLADIGISIAAMAAAYVVIAMPMRGGQGFFYVFERMLVTTGQYSYGTVNGFNFFALLGGNYIPDSETALLGMSYKTLGTIAIVLVLVSAFLFYIVKRDKANFFVAAAFIVAGVFLFGHNMHERYILPATVLLIFAAIAADSRRLLYISGGFSALAFVNIYVVYIYKATWVNKAAEIITAVLMLLVFAALVWTMIRMLRGKKDKSIVPAEEEGENTDAREKFFASAPSPDRRMKKKDYIIMAVIALVYGVAMFINLGSANIPERADAIAEGDVYEIELEENSAIEYYRAYAGYCSSDYAFYYSEDGEYYKEFVLSDDVVQPYGDMFKWKLFYMGVDAKYIRIENVSGELELREIGFTTAEGELIPIKSVALNGTEIEYLTDEQDEVPLHGTSALTNMYFDEIYHARTAYEYNEGIYPYEITHPPLGKSIISLGTRIFGFTPLGWRSMGALAGIAVVCVMYVFAKRIFKRTLWAAAASVLMAADTLLFALARIATIDSFSLLFILLMYYFMYEYTQMSFMREPLWRTLLPLGLCGLSFAIGVAIKWICLYAGVGLAVIFFFNVYLRAKEYKLLKAEGDVRAEGFGRKLVCTLLFCVAVFILIPAAVYCVSYIPYETATGGTFGLQGILDNQDYMFNYHAYLDPENVHPYSSVPYSWPFDIRPVYFFRAEGNAANMVSHIWCVGNPIIMWTGLAAVVALIALKDKKPFKGSGIPFIAVIAAAQFLPWVFITREVYLYHYLPMVPVIIFAIVYLLRHLTENYKWGGAAAAAVVVAAVAVFVLMYPVTTGINMPRWYHEIVQWLPTWPL